MKNFLLLILVILFILTGLILFLELKYIDPFISNKIIIWSFLLSLFFFISSFFTLLLYFFKKIHYRWQVLINHIISSFRQASFISLFFMILGYFIRIGIPIYFSAFLLFILFLFLELFIQNIYW